MYQVEISVSGPSSWFHKTKLGPTDTRSEAVRLAEAWLKSAKGEVTDVRIVEVDEDEDEE